MENHSDMRQETQNRDTLKSSKSLNVERLQRFPVSSLLAQQDRAVQFSRKKAAGSNSKRLSFPRKRESINDADKHGFPLSRE